MLATFIDKTMKLSFWVLGTEVVTAIAAMLILAL